MAPKKPSPIEQLLDVMSQLRDPEAGCPWDIEQTPETIAPYTIEEAYEVADAIASGDMDQLKDELGDLLFQVVFYSQMSREKGGFDFDDVAEGITTKMRNRHPHVFGTAQKRSPEEQNTAWEAQKAQERKAKARESGHRASALDGVALALPSLTRAQKIQKRAAKEGFDWPVLGPVIAKIREELQELEIEIEASSPTQRIADELGDLFFASVNLARHLDVDAETALKKATEKFERRFRYIENDVRSTGREPKETGLEEMERLWSKAKAQE
jgi:ATP diphosphatase